VTLATAVFQVVTKYVNKTRDVIASALPAPSCSGSQQVNPSSAQTAPALDLVRSATLLMS
jgi:hypothetical protein